MKQMSLGVIAMDAAAMIDQFSLPHRATKTHPLIIPKVYTIHCI